MTAPSRTTESTAAPRAFQASIRAVEIARASRAARSRSSAGTADRDHAAVDGRFDAAAGERRGSREPRARGPRVTRRGHDRARERVLAVGLDGAGEREQLGLVDGSASPATATSVTTCWPRGERARLVEQHGVDLAHPLEREPVLHQDAGARRDRGRERDHERDREPERVRARDHEHGDGVLDGLVGVADEHPHDERDRCRLRRPRRTAARRRGRRAPARASATPAPRRRVAGCRRARCRRRPPRPAHGWRSRS